MIIPDPWEKFGHFIQFMVMRGKKDLRSEQGMLMKILSNSPRNGDPIISAGTPADLIEEDQAAI